MYIYGFGVKIDYPKGHGYLISSASQNNSGAEYHMGICYEEGLGVKKSKATALCWFVLSNSHNNSLASYKVNEYFSKFGFFAKKYYYFYGLIWTIFFRPYPEENS